MVSFTTDIKNQPIWAEGYFREFNNWKLNLAPEHLPNGYTDWVSLFSDYSNIFFEVEVVLNDSGTEPIGFKFTWKNENDKLLFILKFS